MAARTPAPAPPNSNTMIELFIIFSRSGLVLFCHQLSALKGDPVDSLIKRVEPAL